MKETNITKSITKTTTFTCDNCHKTQTIILTEKDLNRNPFPYFLGWLYIYNFQWKVNPKNEEVKKDLHFCSKKCCSDFLRACIEGRTLEILFG